MAVRIIPTPQVINKYLRKSIRDAPFEFWRGLRLAL